MHATVDTIHIVSGHLPTERQRARTETEQDARRAKPLSRQSSTTRRRVRVYTSVGAHVAEALSDNARKRESSRVARGGRYEHSLIHSTGVKRCGLPGGSPDGLVAAARSLPAVMKLARSMQFAFVDINRGGATRGVRWQLEDSDAAPRPKRPRVIRARLDCERCAARAQRAHLELSASPGGQEDELEWVACVVEEGETDRGSALLRRLERRV